MVFVGGFLQWLDAGREDAHAVLNVALDVGVGDADWEVGLGEVLDLLSDSELRSAFHF